MAFTGRLGTENSQLGLIELGALGSAEQAASFTADAFIQLYFRADAFIFSASQPTFFADAVILRTQSASFAADAFIRLYFTADAIKRKGQTASFTANATKRKIVSAAFTVDAYLPSFRQRHARTGPHTGVDLDLDHTIAWSFDRYLRGESLQQVLIDIDARLTAREGGRLGQRKLLTANAIRKATMSKSLMLDAYYVSRILTSFTGNAFVQPYFRANALIRAIRSASLLTDAQIEQKFMRANSWIIDPNITIRDDVLTAQTWPLSTTPRAAFINTASLTGDAVNDPFWWDVPGDYVTGWAKITLSSTKTVVFDSVKTGGDTVIEVWEDGPPSWPSDPIGFADEEVDNEESPYPYAEHIEVELTAGTYWVLVHKYNEPDSDFNILLRMYTTT